MNKLLLILSVITITACSSNKPINSNLALNSEDNSDFIVKERNPQTVPNWVEDFSKFKLENNGKGNSYFLGESGDVNDRISGCDLAILSAKKKIAQQIAELISNKIAANKQGRLVIDPSDSNDPGLKRAFEDQIAGKSIAFLSGVSDFGTYWENRDYTKSNGHKRVFQCSSVVMISDKDLRAALMKSSQKAPEVVEDADAKAAVKESLKDIDAQFRAYTTKGI